MIVRESINDRLANASRQVIATAVIAVAVLAVAAVAAYEVVYPRDVRPPDLTAMGVALPVRIYFEENILRPEQIRIYYASRLVKQEGRNEWAQEVHYEAVAPSGRSYVVSKIFWMDHNQVLRQRIITPQ